jgi:hypothetical protein
MHGHFNPAYCPPLDPHVAVIQRRRPQGDHRFAFARLRVRNRRHPPVDSPPEIAPHACDDRSGPARPRKPSPHPCLPGLRPRDSPPCSSRFTSPTACSPQFTPEPGSRWRTLVGFGLPAGVYPLGRLDADSRGPAPPERRTRPQLAPPRSPSRPPPASTGRRSSGSRHAVPSRNSPPAACRSTAAPRCPAARASSIRRPRSRRAIRRSAFARTSPTPGSPCNSSKAATGRCAG